jgi:hypothetical protein
MVEQMNLPFFSMSFESNPIDSRDNYRLELNMLPLEIVYSQSCTDRIISFFLSSASSSFLQEIEIAARRHMDDLRSKTEKLAYLRIENYKTIDMNINIQVSGTIPFSFDSFFFFLLGTKNYHP